MGNVWLLDICPHTTPCAANIMPSQTSSSYLNYLMIYEKKHKVLDAFSKLHTFPELRFEGEYAQM